MVFECRLFSRCCVDAAYRCMRWICMGKTPIASVRYENERISIKKKNSLPYINCVLLLSCVVHGPIYGRFMGFLDMVELCWPVLQILSLTKILFSTPIFRGLFQTSCYRRAKLARLQHDTSTTWFQTSNLIQPNRTAVTRKQNTKIKKQFSKLLNVFQ